MHLEEIAFLDGRVLRESRRDDTLPSVGGDGRPSILGVGPFKFTCLDPFRKWRVEYDGDAYDGTVQQQIAREFNVYADAEPCDIPRLAVAYDVEITMTAPASASRTASTSPIAPSESTGTKPSRSRSARPVPTITAPSATRG